MVLSKKSIIGIIAIMFLLLVLASVLLINAINRDEYVELVQLNDQYLDNFPDTCGGGECNDCLTLNVTVVSGEWFGYDRIYYFATEHDLHEDWYPGDFLVVTWRETGLLYEVYRIKSVQKLSMHGGVV